MIVFLLVPRAAVTEIVVRNCLTQVDRLTLLVRVVLARKALMIAYTRFVKSSNEHAVAGYAVES